MLKCCVAETSSSEEQGSDYCFYVAEEGSEWREESHTETRLMNAVHKDTAFATLF